MMREVRVWLSWLLQPWGPNDEVCMWKVGRTVSKIQTTHIAAQLFVSSLQSHKGDINLVPRESQLATVLLTLFLGHNQILTNMEEDRRQTDLGTAADIEEAQLAQASPSPAETETTPATPLKQPKKRFVGRRAAAEAAAKNGGSGASGESGAVQSMYTLHDESSMSEAILTNHT